MTRNKLAKLESEVASLRLAPQRALALQSLAKKLGRVSVKRGKEPTWESSPFPALRPLSIPDHGGRDVSIGVRNSILNELERDLDAWSEYLDEKERQAKGVTKK